MVVVLVLVDAVVREEEASPGTVDEASGNNFNSFWEVLLLPPFPGKNSYSIRTLPLIDFPFL